MRDYCLARELSSRHELTFLLPDYGDESRAQAEPLKSFCQVRYFELTGGQPWSFSKRLLYSVNQRVPIENAWRLARKEPATVQALEPLFSPLRLKLERTDWSDFDLLQLEHSQMGTAVSDRAIPVPAVLDWHNVYSVMAERQIAQATNHWRKLGAWHEARRVRRSEREVAKRFERSVAVSETDAEGIRKLCRHVRVSIVPNGVDCDYFTNPDPYTFESKSLVFTGTMDYEPNEEAVLYFCAKVLPEILRAVPDVRFYVVGQRPSPVVQDLERRYPGTVRVTGYVEDVRPYLQRSAVSIVPLLNGGGTRLKILEALAMQRPVVSTSVGAEGLGLKAGHEVAIANGSESFAWTILSLLENSDARQRLAAQGNQAARSRFDWKQVAVELEEAWKLTVTSGGRSSG